MPYLPNIEHDDGSCAWDFFLGHSEEDGAVGGLIPFDYPAGAEETHHTR